MSSDVRTYIVDFITYFESRPVELVSWIGRNPLRTQASKHANHDIKKITHLSNSAAYLLFAALNTHATEHQIVLINNRCINEIRTFYDTLEKKGCRIFLCHLHKKTRYGQKFETLHSFIVQKINEEEIYLYQAMDETYPVSHSIAVYDKDPKKITEFKARLMEVLSETSPFTHRDLAFSALFHRKNFFEDIARNLSISNESLIFSAYENMDELSSIKPFIPPPPLKLASKIRWHISAFTSQAHYSLIVFLIIVVCMALWWYFDKSLPKQHCLTKH